MLEYFKYFADTLEYSLALLCHLIDKTSTKSNKSSIPVSILKEVMKSQKSDLTGKLAPLAFAALQVLWVV